MMNALGGSQWRFDGYDQVLQRGADRVIDAPRTIAELCTSQSLASGK